MSRQRIVENINLTSETYFRKKLDLEESLITVNKLNESTQYKALAVYTFPISRPDQKNLNNRIYTSGLWENQIRNKRGEGAFGLMDHPAEEGSTKDAWCVWRNLRFSKDRKLILADAYLFGMWGKQVLEALEAGGSVGLSSSGWGEFLDDNTTLDPDTYELERPADFVLNPSYQVYGVQDDLVESIKNEQTDTSETEVTAINESESTLEFSPKESIEENTMNNDEKKTSPSLEERTFDVNMRSLFKEAKKITDISKRIEENTTLLGYLEGRETDLRSEIEEAISADKAAILEGYNKYLEMSSKQEETEKALNESKELRETVDSLNKRIATLESEKKSISDKNESLSEEFENACTLLDSMKEYTDKQEDLLRIAKAQKNSMISAADHKELLAYSEGLEEDNKKLKKEVLELRRKLRSLIEASKNEEEDDDEDEEDDEEEKDDKKSKAPAKPNDVDSKDDDTDDDEDEDEEEDEKKDESYSVYKGITPEVLEYYEDLEFVNPKVVKIKEEILSKHTLIEAQKTYYKLKSFVEENDTKIYRSGAKRYVESTKKNINPLHEGWV